MTTRPTVPVLPGVPGRVLAQPGRHLFEVWSFAGMAILMIIASIAGFAPAILEPAGRRGPVSALAAMHGIVFFAWLVLFWFKAYSSDQDWSRGTAGWELFLSLCLR
jgi:hypothetical protein